MNGFAGPDGGPWRAQGKEVVHDLPLTLEEVMQGCTKHVKVTRSRLSPEGHGLRSEEKVLNVVVKKGWRAGTKITFPREGDEAPGSAAAADITFILRDKEHPHYRRDGSNIVYTAKISLKEVSLEHPARHLANFRHSLTQADPPAANRTQHPANATVTSAAPAEGEAKYSLSNPHSPSSALPLRLLRLSAFFISFFLARRGTGSGPGHGPAHARERSHKGRRSGKRSSVFLRLFASHYKSPPLPHAAILTSVTPSGCVTDKSVNPARQTHLSVMQPDIFGEQACSSFFLLFSNVVRADFHPIQAS